VSCRRSSGEGERIGAAAPATPLAASWLLPRIDPCAILPRPAVEALVGSSVYPRPGGTTVDGSACQYIGAGPFVITLGFMSTNAYESLKIDFGGKQVPDTGSSALIDGPDQLGDVVLIARNAHVAVLVQISGVIPRAVGPARRALAADIARQALERLNHVTVALSANPGVWDAPSTVPSRRTGAWYTFPDSGNPSSS